MAAPKGHAKYEGAGRKAGTPNKLNKSIAEMIDGALDAKGGQKWIEQQMDNNPQAFMALIGKRLPRVIEATVAVKWESMSDDELKAKLADALKKLDDIDR
jgi:hypothetical protein